MNLKNYILDIPLNYYSIICKNTDTFSKIEKLVYDEYPWL